MSEEKRKIIEMFCRRFIVAEEKPDSFSDILKMSPTVLKGCNKEQAEKLRDHKIKKVKHLIKKIDAEEIDEEAKEIGVNEIDLRKWVMAANLVSRAWRKRSSYLKKEDIKVAVLGLDNAGKTSILENISGNTRMGLSTNLEPTRGVDVRQMESKHYNLVIWDFGGQKGHRHDYQQEPERYFLKIDLVIFVFDMQDSDRFDEALAYFDQIMDILKYLNERPYFLLFLHKLDPDIRDDVKTDINIAYMKEQLKERMAEQKTSFDLVETSIFNFFSTEPEFAQTFKQFFGNKKSNLSTDDYLAKIMKLVLNLSEKMMEQFESLKTILQSQIMKPPSPQSSSSQSPDASFKPSQISSKRSMMPPSKSNSANSSPPPPPSKPDKSNALKGNGGQSKKPNRAQLLSELKEVFQKRNLVMH